MPRTAWICETCGIQHPDSQEPPDRCAIGGHFAGGQVLHWAGGCEGRGALLSGDVVQLVQHRRWVSSMDSYIAALDV